MAGDLSFRSYKYLDTNRIYDYLSSLEPGQWAAEKEVLTEERKTSADAPPSFDAAPNVGTTASGTTRERHINYSGRHAFSRLYDAASDRLKEFDEYTAIEFDQINKRDLIEVTRTFTPSPVNSVVDGAIQVGEMMRNLAPHIGRGDDTELLSNIQAMTTLFAGNPDEERVIPMVGAPDENGVSILFNASEGHIVSTAEDLEGEFTLFGAVDKKVPAGKSVDLFELFRFLPRSLRRAGQAEEVREAVMEMLGNWPDALGGPIDRDSLTLHGPILVVAAVACYTS